ncbi:Ribokinase-like protein [Dipodascopsis tothii]|uniref:Ribokinase-like protein n=1 Tax=Dipodascopsis tothii TaxID=44089 RepID=UPI0034CF2856
MSQKRILSVQSHVVHGYVGNRVAAFPLQLLEWDVDVVNTVVFSNHTGYRQWEGTRTSAQQILDLYAGLEKNTLTDYDVVLTGYIPDAASVRAMGTIVKKLRFENPRLVWVLDPVLGDENKLYVSADVVPAYRDVLLPMATVITPNQFEAEMLTETKITALDQIPDVLQKLHQRYKVKHVVISSVVFEAGATEFVCVGSSARSDGTPRPFYLRLPFIDQYFTGTGDLFAALLADRFHRYTNGNTVELADSTPASELPLVSAVRDVSTIVQSVLRRTHQHVIDTQDRPVPAALLSSYGMDAAKAKRIRDMKYGELQLISSQDAIRNPVVTVEAEYEF